MRRERTGWSEERAPGRLDPSSEEEPEVGGDGPEGKEAIAVI